MKTKIKIMAFIVVGLVLANTAKSQRNNTQIQERTNTQVQPIPTPPPTSTPVFNNDVRYETPTQIQPQPITPQTNTPVFNNDVKYITPTQVQPQTTPVLINTPVINNDVKSASPTQAQSKIPPLAYDSLYNGEVIQGTPIKPKPINPHYNYEINNNKMLGAHLKAKSDTINKLKNKIIDTKTTVYFVNESTTNTSYDVIWDGVFKCSISPGQTSSIYYAITNANHTLEFKVKNTNTLACSFIVPHLNSTAYNFTCSY